MREFPEYALLGAGRFGKRILSILASENRRCTVIPEPRQRSSETDDQYRERLKTAFSASGARVAWLTVSPGSHVAKMIQAAMDAGLHVLVEKPWLGTADVTRKLLASAKQSGLQVGFDYEYCFLTTVEQWRTEFGGRGKQLRFGGRFYLNRINHSGLSAIDNLGTHLLAIREYVVPEAEVAELTCAYETPDERRIWIKQQNGPIVAELDLLKLTEPIIQRLFKIFESTIADRNFPIDLNFALRVAEQVNTLR